MDFYRNYSVATRPTSKPVQRRKNHEVDLSATHDSYYYNLVHSRICSTNMPPQHAVLEDADVLELMFYVIHQGKMGKTFLYENWPETFTADGLPLPYRRQRGRPGIAWSAERGRFGYVSIWGAYTLCGIGHVLELVGDDPDFLSTEVNQRNWVWQRPGRNGLAPSYNQAEKSGKYRMFDFDDDIEVRWDLIEWPTKVDVDRVSQTFAHYMDVQSGLRRSLLPRSVLQAWKSRATDKQRPPQLGKIEADDDSDYGDDENPMPRYTATAPPPPPTGEDNPVASVETPPAPTTPLGRTPLRTARALPSSKAGEGSSSKQPARLFNQTEGTPTKHSQQSRRPLAFPMVDDFSANVAQQNLNVAVAAYHRARNNSIRSYQAAVEEAGMMDTIASQSRHALTGAMQIAEMNGLSLGDLRVPHNDGPTEENEDWESWLTTLPGARPNVAPTPPFPISKAVRDAVALLPDFFDVRYAATTQADTAVPHSTTTTPMPRPAVVIPTRPLSDQNTPRPKKRVAAQKSMGQAGKRPKYM